MLTALYAVLIGLGAALAQVGDEPIWIVAIIALTTFPLAATAAVRGGDGRARVPIAPGLLTALTGGVLAGLLVRLAILAPDWVDAGAADCGGPSTGTQQLVLWVAALIFVLALLPVAAMLVTIGSRMSPGGRQIASRGPLALYPLAVAGSGLALIGASLVTTC